MLEQAHTAGSNVDILNNSITLPVKTNRFESQLNELVYFNPAQSVGVGTTVGGAIDVDTFIGDLKTTVSIPIRTIRIPNHPFSTGQELILNKRNGANRFDVSTNPLQQQFKLPFTGQNSTKVYVIDKGPDNIGLVTTRVGIGSTSEGLFFFSRGSVSGISSSLYFFEPTHTQVTGTIDQITTRVSTNISAAKQLHIIL